MKSMKLSKADKEASYPQPAEIKAPQYPYGLCLRLGKEEIAKLGITGIPEVGQVFKIEAKASVQSLSMSVGKSGDYASIELQITDMGLEHDGEDKKAKAARMLFGGSMGEKK